VEAGRDASVVDVVGDSEASHATCHLELKAGVDAGSAFGCLTRRRDFPTDAGSDTYVWLTSDPAVGGDTNIQVVISCSGKLALGRQVVWPPSPCRVAQATVSSNGVEWIGLWGVQGTLALSITAVRMTKVGSREVFEVHGILEATLPVSNAFDGPVALRASF
jgi:hypothetical protein